MPATSLLGRDEDVAIVERLIAGHRLVTLTGTGGSGKTRLAIAVAGALVSKYTDGAVFVGLQDTSGRTEVASAIGTALALPQHPNHDVEDSLFDHLRSDLECLLVLDNFEHVISSVPLVQRLLDAAPGIDILVTSRAPLRLSGEHERVVAPLGVPDPDQVATVETFLRSDAVALFISRSQAVGASLSLSVEELAAIAEITRRLDGLPLAIELAAAQTRWLEPAALLPRLEHSLPLLGKGPRDAPARQQTLRATFEWSHELLQERERALLARLSVFVGGWSIGAAERVCGDDSGSDQGVVDGIESLVESSLIRPLAGNPDGARFTMLQVMREFAAGQLAQTADHALFLARHADWILGLVKAAEPELVGRDPRTAQHRLRADEENIRAALRWSIADDRAELAMGMAGRLWEFWHYWAEIREGVEWLETVLAMPGAMDHLDARAKALAALANLRQWQGREAEASSLFDEALLILGEVGDPREVARAHRSAMWTALGMDDVGSARRHATEWWRSFHGTADDDGGRSLERTLEILGSFPHDQASSVRVAKVMEEDIEARRRAERPLQVAAVTNNLGYVHYLGGSFDRALDAGRAAVRMLHQLGHIGRIGQALWIVAATESAIGRPERALVIGTVSHRLSSELGALPSAWVSGVGDPVSRASAQLSPEAQARAIEAGRSVSLDDAVAFALSDRSTVPRSSRPERAHGYSLTAREREVLDLVVDGRTDGEIAEALFISPKTASVHVSNIKGKLGAESRVEIVTIAMRMGLVRLDAGSGQ